MSERATCAVATRADDAHHRTMIDVGDVEGDAAAIYERCGLDAEEPPSIGQLCTLLTGFAPTMVPHMLNEGRCGRVGDAWRVFVRAGLPKERAVFITAHECAEWFYRSIDYREPDIEHRCDALGAYLVAPRAAFRLAIATLGHSVRDLASAFNAPRSLALLRIGETTGRPVILLRREPIARGDDFGWPSGPGLARAVKRPPPSVHPVRAGDYWGLMARR